MLLRAPISQKKKKKKKKEKEKENFIGSLITKGGKNESPKAGAGMGWAVDIENGARW